jgi:hypothetical protein
MIHRVCSLIIPMAVSNECPQHETEPSVFCLSSPFVAEIVERLLHGLAKPLPELSWIKSEELLVESPNCFLFIHCMQKFSNRVSVLELT